LLHGPSLITEHKYRCTTVYCRHTHVKTSYISSSNRCWAQLLILLQFLRLQWTVTDTRHSSILISAFETASTVNKTCLFLGGLLGPLLTQCGLNQDVKIYMCTKWHLDSSSCLATTDMGRKLRGAGSPSNTISSGPWAVAYLRTKWHLDPCSRLARTNGPKIGGCAPFLGEGS